MTENLLIQHSLDSLSSDDLKKLFQKTLKKHKIRFEARTSGPRGCVFYCKNGTCQEGDRCKFFHVCEKYINGTCKSEVECGLCHSFETKHARRVLAFHKLGDVRNDEQILSVLRSSIEPQPGPEKIQTSLDMKLFSHLITHGEKCRLPIADVEKCLQEFSEDKVTFIYLLVNISSLMGLIGTIKLSLLAGDRCNNHVTLLNEYKDRSDCIQRFCSTF